MPDETILQQRQVSRVCDTHGAFTATVTRFEGIDEGTFFEPPARCPDCSAAAAAAHQAREQADKRWEAERLRRSSGVPARFATASFETWDTTTPRMRTVGSMLANFVERWDDAAAHGQWLLLVGGPGTGKTHLACAMVKALADRLVAGTYGNATELLGTVRQHYGKRGGEGSVAEAIAHLQTVPLLVIDEISIGLTEHDLNLLFRVMDSRYANRRPLIMISNLPADQLESALGHRLMDRMRDDGVTIRFDWPSQRGKLARPRMREVAETTGAEQVRPANQSVDRC